MIELCSMSKGDRYHGEINEKGRGAGVGGLFSLILCNRDIFWVDIFDPGMLRSIL